MNVVSIHKTLRHPATAAATCCKNCYCKKKVFLACSLFALPKNCTKLYGVFNTKSVYISPIRQKHKLKFFYISLNLNVI